MRKRHLIGIFIIIAFIIFSAVSFKNSLTPYVTFAQAKNISGNVQVKGVLVSPQVIPMESGKAIAFLLRDDDGTEAIVTYFGAKPDNMEDATSIVAIGNYHENRFIAEKLLVKCPSKYQSSQGSVEK